MAIEKKRMKQLRGAWSNFDKSKLLPGEFAMITSGGKNSKDGRELHFAFSAGLTKQLFTYEDGMEMIDNATQDIQLNFTESVRAAADNANEKAIYATSQGDYAKKQGDYAKGKGDYAGVETVRIQTEFDTIRDIILETDTGVLLLEVKQLLEDMYRRATETDIDNIIGDQYVDEDETSTIFETGTNEDIDNIIGGAYVDGPEEGDGADITEIQAIIDSLFK